MTDPVGTPQRHADLGPLHDLLLKAARKDSTGRGTIRNLAEDMMITPWALYKCLKKNNGKGRLTADRVRRIIAASEGRVTIEEFIPYLG
jgi:hypothetical protein